MTFNFNIGGITPQDAQNQGGGGTTAVESLSPTKTAGLMLWLDGQCNTRQGNDHTKKYMENLVWNVPTETDVTNREVFPSATSGNVWGENDFLKLATYAYYPVCTSGQLTLELVFKTDSDADGIINPFRQDGGSNAGFYTAINQVSDGSEIQLSFAANVGVKQAVEQDKAYYFAGTIEGAIAKTFLNGVSASFTSDVAYNAVSTTNVPAGIGLAPNGADSSRWKGLNLAMLRLWNRVLSDSEILANYEDAKKRFKV